jgi:hypothetical protein
MRAVQVPRPVQRLYEISGGFADRPLSDIEKYASKLTAGLNYALSQASLGDGYPMVLRCKCVINADEELNKAYMCELERIKPWLLKHPRE